MTDDKLIKQPQPGDDGPVINIPFPSCAVCGRAEVEGGEFKHGPVLCLMSVRCHDRYQIVVIPAAIIHEARLGGAQIPKGRAFAPGDPVFETHGQFIYAREALLGIQAAADRRYLLHAETMLAACGGLRDPHAGDRLKTFLEAFGKLLTPHGLCLVLLPTSGAFRDYIELRWISDAAPEYAAATERSRQLREDLQFEVRAQPPPVLPRRMLDRFTLSGDRQGAEYEAHYVLEDGETETVKGGWPGGGKTEQQRQEAQRAGCSLMQRQTIEQTEAWTARHQAHGAPDKSYPQPQPPTYRIARLTCPCGAQHSMLEDKDGSNAD